MKTYTNKWQAGLVNIAKQAIVEGSLIIMSDPEAPLRDYWTVVSRVEKTPMDSVRKIHGVVVKSESVLHTINSPVLFTLDSNGTPMMGFYVQDGLDAEGLDNFGYKESDTLKAHIISILKSADMQGYQLTTSEIVKKFKEVGLIKPGLPNAKARELILKVVKLNQNVLFHNGRGCIRLMTEHEMALRQEAVNTSVTSNIKDVKYIDQDLFLKGVIAIAESGIMGNIVWTGKRALHLSNVMKDVKP